MTRVLITGGGGFLADYLASCFSADEYILVGLVRNSLTAPEQKFDKVYTDVGSLLENEARFDMVFHLASFIPRAGSNEPNREFIDTNIMLTSRLVLAYWNSRFVFASSTSVYGNPQFPILSIDSCFNKPGIYGLSKIAGEAVVSNHPDHAIVRFSSIIGKEMKRHTFIPRLIDQSITGEICLWGDGSRKQNYIDVRDAARLMRTCATYKGNILTLGVGSQSYSNSEVAQMVAKNNRSQIKYQGTDESPSFTFDARESYGKLGFHPEFTLEESIAHMMNGSDV